MEIAQTSTGRGRGAWACLAHALQCLCDGRACCPARALQLVICVFLRSHRHRHPVVSTRCVTGMVRVGVKIPLIGNGTNCLHVHDMYRYTLKMLFQDVTGSLVFYLLTCTCTCTVIRRKNYPPPLLVFRYSINVWYVLVHLSTT